MQPSEDKVRVAIIGAGNIAHSHAHGYLAHTDRAKIVAIADVEKGLAQQLASGIDGEQLVTTDVAAVLASDEVDAVSICTPPSSHLELFTAALDHKKHILLEKPIATSIVRARQAAQQALDAPTLTGIAFKYRFMPGIERLRQLLQRGELGRLLRFDGRYLIGIPPELPAGKHWRHLESVAGPSGCLGDLGVHIIDLARLLVGEIARVVGRTAIVAPERVDEGGERWKCEVPDQAFALIDFDNGCVGSIEATYAAVGRTYDFRIEVNGTRGNAIWEYRRPAELTIAMCNSVTSPPEISVYRSDDHQSWPDNAAGNKESFVRLTGSFLDTISSGTGAVPGLSDALRAEELVDAILRSSERNEAIETSSPTR